MIPLLPPMLDMPRALQSDQAVRSDGSAPKKDESARKAALEFESILVRQMLGPLEKSLTAGMGGGSASSPMVGSMILESLSRSIADGGGLGLAAVFEQAFTAPSDGTPSAGNAGPKDGK